MKRILCYGPPGTGKTRKLTEFYAKCAEVYGTDRVGFVTYTKAAATEAQERIAAMLGLTKAPMYVGTIHSLAYGALGRPTMVDGRGGKWSEFLAEQHLTARDEHRYWSSTPEQGGLWWADMGADDEADLFRRALASSKHQRITIEDAILDLPAEKQPLANRLIYLADQYEEWKQDQHLMDFEDLLERGMAVNLGLRVLIVDEVQDNSKLMWEVIDGWERDIEIEALAGDPYQAIYRFVGADPRLFTEREGTWYPLTMSHRLSASAAAFANRVLLEGGWDDDRFIGTWTGEGGHAVDGTTAYIARTQRLLAPIRAQLQDAGEPYAEVRGKNAPLQTKAAEAYRFLTRLTQGDQGTYGQLLDAAKAISAASLRRGTIPELGREPRARTVGEEGAQYWLGPLAQAKERVQHADYFASIERKYGLAGLERRPTTVVGTIHSVKGKEYDHVKLVRSWGVLPAQEMYASDAGRRSETCVAYVATSRHRVDLELIEAEMGMPYPFPSHVP